MDLSTFLHDRRPSWKRLEELLERAEGSGLACLNEDEAVEFGNLYRRAASDLNQAQTFVSGDVTVRYLNDLVARAYLAHLRQDPHRPARHGEVPRLRAGRPCSDATCRIFWSPPACSSSAPSSGSWRRTMTRTSARPFLLPTDMQTIQPREEGQNDPTDANVNGRFRRLLHVPLHTQRHRHADRFRARRHAAASGPSGSCSRTA